MKKNIIVFLFTISLIVAINLINARRVFALPAGYPTNTPTPALSPAVGRQIRCNPSTGAECDENYQDLHANWEEECVGITTAVGCVPFGNTNSLIGFFLGWGIGIAGGIAFLLMVYATFLIITSAGDPKKLNAGKELLVAALSGLFLLIFSVFLLRLIGKDILNIPGL